MRKRTLTKERKQWIKKLDRIFSEYIRKRDGRCVVCGSTENLQCGHLFSRVAYSTRWDEENAYCQCRSCNMMHEFDPYPLMEFARQKLGQEKLDMLYKRYKRPVKVTEADMQVMYGRYQKKLQKLEE